MCDYNYDSTPDILLAVDGDTKLYFFQNSASGGPTCYNRPCQNNGFCVPTGTYTFYCDCSATPFGGDRCQTALPYNCSFTPCSNGGVCTNDFVCDCSATNYGGIDCTSTFFSVQIFFSPGLF